MTAHTPRQRGPRRPWLAVSRWGLVPLLVLPAWGWTLWAAPGSLLAPVLVTGAAVQLLLVVLVWLLDRRERRVQELRRHIDEIHAEAASMAGQHLPGMVKRLNSGESAARVLHSTPQPRDPAGRAILGTVAHEIAAAERRRSSAMVTCATAAGRVQALTTTMLADLRQMQDRHGDGSAGADVLGDLMHLDHATAQTGRVADSIAVLTGARSGRRWGRAIAMESVVRGAMGRIGGYQRVCTHHIPSQAIAGFAAEGVIHALAEILDNAARFSPPTAEVHVHVEEVQAGIAIMVEDAGLVMGEESLGRARDAVESGLDITAISGTRLGLSVVGQIARRYDLSVSFRSSSRGGTAVVVLLPQKLVKPLSAQRGPTAAPLATGKSAPAPTPAPEESATDATHSPEILRDPDHGLPTRRRGRTLAAVERTRTAPDSTRATTSAKGLSAFRSAVRGQDPTGAPKDT